MKIINWFKPAKYCNKWAVFDERSCTFSFIGCSKRYCCNKSKELNKYIEKHEKL